MAQCIYGNGHGDAFLQLRAGILTNQEVQRLLSTREDFRDLVTGVYCMNKVGRLRPKVVADDAAARESFVFAEQHARILAATGDDLTRLFLHLRDCCPVIFAYGV